MASAAAGDRIAGWYHSGMGDRWPAAWRLSPPSFGPLIRGCAIALALVGAMTAYAGETQYLRNVVLALRRKLEADPAHPRFLVTEPGIGYRFRTAADG